MNCPDPATLESLLRSDIDLVASETIREHIDRCDSCQERLEQLTANVELRSWLKPSGSLEYRESIAASREPAVGFSFLDPPIVEGDLGSIDGYRIISVLGNGGMGLVLQAFDAALDRRVALKVIRPERLDETSRTRFVREAQAMARVCDDHVVSVYSVVDVPELPPYLVMEFIEGPTLAQWIKERGRLPPGEAVDTILQVCRGLQRAHASGLIHRDIKPANIILDRRAERWKLMDFGLVQDLQILSRLTHHGTLAGTPEYMSPEQAQGMSALDARSDIYSLGLALYESLTGETPFRGAPHLVLQQVACDEPRPPRSYDDSIPRDVEIICLKAISKDPSRRYASAEEFAADLMCWQRDQPIRARPAAAWEVAARRVRRHRGVTAMAALLAVVVIGANLGLWKLWRAAETSAAAERQQSIEADEMRSVAELSRDDAIAALDQYLQFVLDDEQLKKPELTELRKKMANAWADQYRNVLSRQENDQKTLELLARGFTKIAETLQWSGTRDEAVESWKQAVRVLTDLAERQPDDASIMRRLARARLQLGQLHSLRMEYDAAEAALSLAERDFRRIQELDPENPPRTLLVMCRGIQANLAHGRGDSTAAAEACRNVRDLLREMADREPDQIGHRQNLGTAEHNLAVFLLDLKDRHDEVVEALQRACAIRGEIIGETTDHWDRRNLARSELFLAAVLQGRGELEAAEKSCRSAIHLLEAVVEAKPGGSDYQSLLAEALVALGDILERDNRREQLPELVSRCLEIYKGIEARDAGYLAHNANIGSSLPALIDFDVRTNGARHAVTIADILVRRGSAMVAENPDDPRGEAALVDAWSRRAAIFASLGDWSAASRDLESAAAEQEKLVQRSDSDASQANVLLELRIRTAQARFQTGRREEAAAMLQQLAPQSSAALSAAFLTPAMKPILKDPEFRRLLEQVLGPVEVVEVDDPE